MSSGPRLSSKNINYDEELKRISGWVWWSRNTRWAFFIKELSGWAGDPFRVTDHYHHPAIVTPGQFCLLILNIRQTLVVILPVSFFFYIRYIRRQLKGFNKPARLSLPSLSPVPSHGKIIGRFPWAWKGVDPGGILPRPSLFLLPPPDDQDNHILPYGELGLNCFSICWPGGFFLVLKTCSDIICVVKTFLIKASCLF